MSQQTVINGTGLYRTARGELVKIYKIVPGDYGCFGEFMIPRLPDDSVIDIIANKSGTIQVWDATGRLFRDKTTEGDIIGKLS